MATHSVNVWDSLLAPGWTLLARCWSDLGMEGVLIKAMMRGFTRAGCLCLAAAARAETVTLIDNGAYRCVVVAPEGALAGPAIIYRQK